MDLPDPLPHDELPIRDLPFVHCKEKEEEEISFQLRKGEITQLLTK